MWPEYECGLNMNVTWIWMWLEYECEPNMKIYIEKKNGGGTKKGWIGISQNGYRKEYWTTK